MKNWIVKLLGGFTQEDMDASREEFRKQCVEFCDNNLNKEGEVLLVNSREVINGGYSERHVLILGDSSHINNVSVKGFKVAPWAKYNTVQNSSFYGEYSALGEKQ